MPQLLLGAVGSIDAETIRNAVVFMVALILSVTVHEFGHAKVADILGDRLPRAQGRVTLNPASHIDPIGTLALPLIGFFLSMAGAPFGLIGWGKPVRIALTQPRYRWGLRRRTADFLISAAGVTMNIAFALVLSIAFVVGIRLGAGEAYADVVSRFILMNIALFFFNLIPCPPLDGGRLLTAVIGPGQVSEFIEKNGFVIFIVLIVSGAVRWLLWPAVVVGKLWIGLLVSWAL